MAIINSNNLIYFIYSYFDTLGCGQDALNYLNRMQFTDALVLKLPEVCLIPKNRSSFSTGKQTHIHITGESRYFFFQRNILDTTTQNIEYSLALDISLNNVHSINGMVVNTPQQLNLVSTTTILKYSIGHQSQVQVSKLRQDGSEFIDLRKGLYLNDLLIFCKTANNHYFAVGIPTSFYINNNWIITQGVYSSLVDVHTALLNNNKVSVQYALDSIIESVDTNTLIKDDDQLSESIYQELVNTSEFDVSSLNHIVLAPQKYNNINTTKTVHSNRPPTNPLLGKQAIQLNNTKCIFATKDYTHETFLKSNGEVYMEAHHLIPLKYQSDFSNKLDTIGNIVPLCPLCHRKIHYGTKDNINFMLEELYKIKVTELQKCGLDITLDELKKYYTN